MLKSDLDIRKGILFVRLTGILSEKTADRREHPAACGSIYP